MIAHKVWISLVALVVAGPVLGLEAPAAHDAPIRGKSLRDAQLHALPQETVAAYLQQLSGAQTYSLFAGQNSFLAAKSDDGAGNKKLAVGEIAPLDLSGRDVFFDRLVDNGYHVFLGAVHSVDAESVRLQADLSALGAYDELYVVDPIEIRAVGPFTRDDQEEGGRWLPLVEGDMAVVVLRSAAPDWPSITFTSYAHGFRNLGKAAKQLSCNNLIACENSALIQDRSSGVGRYVVVSGFSLFLCSGSLVNNADSPELEPYFLTANHCVSSQSEAASVEVYWDYRTANCSPAAQPPALGSLLRSDGVALLATSSTLDYTLIQLDAVDAGTYGRTYLGWSTTLPNASADVVGIHHPQGSHMRISYGDVTATGQSTFGYQEQIRVEWFDGVTEGGSSGSPLLLENNTLPIIGALSNGAQHVCPENPDQNFDYYASFAAFFPQVDDYLTGNDPASLSPVCPAAVTLKDHPELLKALRDVRDSRLAETPLGQKLIADYYRAAPGLSQIVTESRSAQGLFAAGAGAASRLGLKKD